MVFTIYFLLDQTESFTEVELYHNAYLVLKKHLIYYLYQKYTYQKY